MEEFNILHIPTSIRLKIGRNLHLKENHPVCIIKELIYDYFRTFEKIGRTFKIFEDLHPFVSVEDNFDKLLIPKDHPARSKSDTYYLSETRLLRTHTSAHQNSLLSDGETSFLITGDVYRKDEIDSKHYPVFHQMEGVYIDTSETMNDEELKQDLINTLQGLCTYLFPGCPTRVNDDYFPFTDPSFEIEVFYRGRWIEILGSGVVQNQIIVNCSEKNQSLLSAKNDGTVKRGWAFGLGLERLAMILFEIPDIRLMWVDSEKFTSQFVPKTITKFKPYSTLDPLSKDVSFYIPDEQVVLDPETKIENVDRYTDPKTGIVRIWSRENDMFEIIRESASNVYSDLVSKVEMFDQFYNTKQSKLSRTYRITYCPPDPEMNDPGRFTALVNSIHLDIAKNIESMLGVVIR